MLNLMTLAMVLFYVCELIAKITLKKHNILTNLKKYLTSFLTVL